MNAMYTVRAKVMKYPGMDGWFFAMLPKTAGGQIKKTYGPYAGGWGSLKVNATIGKTTWQSSIFPDKKSGSYVLPLKAQIRKAEHIIAGKTVVLTVTIRPGGVR